MLARSCTTLEGTREETLARSVHRRRVVARRCDGPSARRQTSARDRQHVGHRLRDRRRAAARGRRRHRQRAVSVDRRRRHREPQATGRAPKGFAADMATAEGTAAIHAAFPNVDILVNNVGGYGPLAFEESTDDEWYRLIDLNVMSGVRLSRLYLPRMRETNWGRIIFISSESAYHIPPDMIHYGMTKAAQIAVARGLAKATATTGITVNSVLPGPTRTQGADNFLRQQEAQGRDPKVAERQFFDAFRPTSLIKRFADPDEVGNFVAYVASPLASATTGAALRVDGGTVKSAY